MRRYETITILKPNLAEDDLKAVVDRSTSIIEGFKGSIIKLNHWGLKKLAYLIDKENQGYYLYMQYAGTPEAVKEMERVYRIDDRVMKFLTVKLQDVFSALPEDEAAEEPEKESSGDTEESKETETA